MTYKYADRAVSIKEDQPSISLGYTNYIRAMAKEYIERGAGGAGVLQHIEEIYNAYDAALIYLKDEDRKHLIDSIKKQVRILERETKINSGIDFDSDTSTPDLDSFLQKLNESKQADDPDD